MADLLGTPGNDNGTDAPALTGTDEADVINGLTGDDLVEGLGGDDFLTGAFGIDTVRGGDGDDRVLLLIDGSNEGEVLAGGAGFDRLILEPRDFLAIYAIEAAEVSGFEQIDLNGNRILLNPEQLDGIERITGFGADGALWIHTAGSVDLGGIAVGETGTGVGQIRPGLQLRGDFTWDATGATAPWRMRDSVDTNRALLVGGGGDDTLRGGAGDTLRGGAGDDTLIWDRVRFVTDLPFMVIDGGDGRDRVSADGRFLQREYSNIVFENVEVFVGSGNLRATSFAGFETFEEVGVLSMATPGTVDLSGRVVSTEGTNANGADQFMFRGSDAADSITWTDTRFNIIIEPGRGNDTVTTGDGNDIIRTDTLAQGADDDLIRTGDGSDTVDGSDGDDTIIAWGSDADGADRVAGGSGADSIEGGAGGDLLAGFSFTFAGPSNDPGDTIDGGLGGDRIIGSNGADLLIGGPEDGDLADIIQGFGGDDTIRAGAGNDSVFGDAGDDDVLGGSGADTITGNAGNDTISGGSLGDLLFGNDGDDFINGGFGSDRINLGAGADRVFHAGLAGHGSDWVQDFTAEDALVAAGGSDVADFQVNIANTANAGAADVDEAFVIYTPTGQILWALVDGAALDTLTLRIDEIAYDLL